MDADGNLEAEAGPSVLCDDERLTRYLKTGAQGTFFLPGKNKVFKMFHNPMVTMINAGRGKEAVAELIRIDQERLYLKREPLLFLLSVAAHSSDLETKRAAFGCLGDVCHTPVDLFYFLKHMKDLSQFTKGWGRALRRAVCDWYNSKDPFQLAEMVTRYKSHGRWSHIDVLRLAHIKPVNASIGFIVKAVTKGLEEAKSSLEGDVPADIQKIIEYLEAVETVKHTDDGDTVARLMEQHNLHVEHIPTPMLASKEVWNTILDQMSLNDMLNHLTSLARRRFLVVSPEGTAVDEVTKVIQEKVLSRVKDETAIEKEKISPIRIYITLKNYMEVLSPKTVDQSVQVDGLETVNQFVQVDGPETEEKHSADVEDGPHLKKKRKKKKCNKGEVNEKHLNSEESVVKSRSDKVVNNNPELYQALRSAFRVAVKKNIPVTNKRFLVAVKSSLSTISLGIRGNPAITPLEVMALMATFIKKKEKNPELGSYTAAFSLLNYQDEVQDLIQTIGNSAAPVPNLQCDPAAPVAWALEKNKPYDVFLVMSDGSECKGEISPADTLAEYREKMNLPDTKMITCGLTSPTMDFAEVPGMLDIGGFDEMVLSVIYQFIQGEL